jgi:hypothetical protein
MGVPGLQKTPRTEIIVVSADIPRATKVFRNSKGCRPDSCKQQQWVVRGRFPLIRKPEGKAVSLYFRLTQSYVDY